MARHGDTEKFILNLFKESCIFSYKGNTYTIKTVGKPRPPRGECKTDIYILAVNEAGFEEEFKISIKQHNADFLENKISADRALEILGENYRSIITKSLEEIKDDFINDYKVYFKRFKKTEPNCIKIGWKFEFINKPGGVRSGILDLNPSQKIDIFSGSNLSISKRDSRVNGTLIYSSGVSNYILEVDELVNDLNYYTDRLVGIEKFAVEQEIYFACKAINYRVDKDKWDGNRPLSVYCNWFINKNNKIDLDLILSEPLEIKANVIGSNIREILKMKKITANNFGDLLQHLDSSLIIYTGV